MQMEGVVSVIQIVDNHVHDMALIDSRDELRVRESRGSIGSIVPQVIEKTASTLEGFPCLRCIVPDV